MSAEGAETTGAQGPEDTAAGPGGREPTEEELRAAYEAELSRLTTTDMIAQTAVSLLNLGARRLAPPSEDPTRPSDRDLEQARDAIDAVRALLDILERRIPQELRPLREALSRLQMAYAQELGTPPTPQATPPPAAEPADATASGESAPAGAASPADGDSPPGDGEKPPGPDRRSRAAGCGCPDGERGRRLVPDRPTPAGAPPAGTIDCARVCTG